ncbi:protein SSUH2 homolog [Herrania umbratica]|uniref:Protein SSUH2 homolog n=1 Tax=Herrania umbratica TaxID=108875 RepID=A0A6J1AL65_9ROSI|nr:protein SSUH2 homolog [Herrania umbratica]
MPTLFACHNTLMASPASPLLLPRCSPAILNIGNREPRPRVVTVFAATSGPLNSILKRCEKCGGKGAIECPGCKGTGKNKKNGNIFERWKCFDCQGFGLKSCPSCGQGGLTPEQRGER